MFIISNELIAKQTGLNIFENIGKASLEFAKEYPILFRELTMQPNQYMASYETLEKTILEAMTDDKSMSTWTNDERKKLLFKMRAFQIGLSAMVANDHLPSWLNEKDVENLLIEMGEGLLLVANIKKEENKQ